MISITFFRLSNGAAVCFFQLLENCVWTDVNGGVQGGVVRKDYSNELLCYVADNLRTQ